MRDVPFDSIDPVSLEYFWMAEIYAVAGRPGVARRLLEEELTVRESRASFRDSRALAQAAIDLAESRPEAALERIRPVLLRAPEDRGCIQVGPCAVYLAARAYEMQGSQDQARAMYRRFVEAPYNQIFYQAFHRADALERLAALEEQAGNRVAAASAYERLLALWSNADGALLPRVRHARGRYRDLVGDAAG